MDNIEGDGEVLQTGERCAKKGESVMEVLRTKHPEACTRTAASPDSYPDRPPEIVPVNITDDTATAVAGQLLGGASPGGTDSFRLQHRLLRFGAASG